MSRKIVALGEPLVEFTAERPGPLKDVDRFLRGWGGDTSTAAIAAARLGGDVRYVTRVGDDDFGRAFLGLWTGEGVDTGNVTIDDEAPTGFYFAILDGGGERRFIYHRSGSAATRITGADLHGALDGAGVLHVSGIMQAISEGANRTMSAAVEGTRTTDVLVSYDANVRPILADQETLLANFRWATERADIIFLSDEDAGYLSRDAGDLIGALPPRATIVVKHGPDGCSVLDHGTRTEIAGHPVDAVDTTGAGDAFAGAYLVATLGGDPPVAAARFANAAAALSTTVRGAVAGLPRRDQIEPLLVS